MKSFIQMRKEIADLQRKLDEAERKQGPSVKIDKLREGLAADDKKLEKLQKNLEHADKLDAVGKMLRKIGGR